MKVAVMNESFIVPFLQLHYHVCLVDLLDFAFEALESPGLR